MVKTALAIVFCLLLFCSVADAKIIGNISTDSTVLKTVTLDQARVKEDNGSSANTSSNISQPATKTESIPGSDVVSGWVTAGLNGWLRGLVDGMYGSFENNSAVNNQFGSPRGALYTAITYVPNPYEDPNIKSLYKNYNDIAIFFVILFIFGEWTNRRLAVMKVTSSVFGEKDLSTSHFFGGLCMCGIALFANFFFMFALQIIQALSQFAMSNVLDSIAPSPDNLILYFMMALDSVPKSSDERKCDTIT